MMSASELYIVSIAKNEGRYLREWLAYHLKFNPKAIIVYDNESSDDTLDILNRAAQNHPVRRVLWQVPEGTSPQLSAYNNALKLLHAEAGPKSWAAFIDLDEFIVETGCNTLQDILRSASEKTEIGAIAMNQRVYGDSGLSGYTPEPVMQRFTRCCRPDHVEAEYIKSIYRINCIESISDAHGSGLSSGIYVTPNLNPVSFSRGHSCSTTIDFDSIQLNHYITKTFEEYQNKRARGGGMARTKDHRLMRYDDSFFYNRQGLINQMECPHNARLTTIIKRQLDIINF